MIKKFESQLERWHKRIANMAEFIKKNKGNIKSGSVGIIR